MKQISKQFFVEFKADQIADDGSIKGYASTFNTINSYGDYVSKGAYANTLKKLAESGRKLPCLWQHNAEQPIGFFTVLKEDDVGLYVELTLLDEVALSKEAKALIKAGVVTGFSIGAYVVDYEINKDNTYNLKELDLQEISVVTFPADDKARIKQSKKDLDVRELEQSLRDVGCSRSIAKKYACEICRATSDEQKQCDAGKQEKEQISKLISIIRGL